MIGVRFDINYSEENSKETAIKTYESLTAPVLDRDGDLVVVAVEISTGKIATIEVDDIKKLNKPAMPKLDS